MPTTTIYVNKDSRISLQNGWEAGSGTDPWLPAGVNGSFLFRSLIGFSYSFTGWTGITAATLHLTTSTQGRVAFGSDPDIQVNRVTEAWSEGSAYDLSGSNSVIWPGPAATSTNQVTASVPATNNTDVSINILGIMQDALAAGVFYGLRIKAVVESAADTTEFWSRENGTGTRAYITITYSTNNAPNAPTSLLPTGGAIQQTITPVFSGVQSDPDAGDTMSGVQIQVYDDSGSTGSANLVWDSGILSASGTTFSKNYAGSALTGDSFYRWRARTKDAAGAVGTYSSLQRFKVNSVPTAPTLAIDGTSTDELTLTPVLSITHNDPDDTDTDINAYHVTVYRNGDSAVMWDTGDITLGTTTRTLALTYAGTALSWGTSYFYTARTKDKNGAWSPYASFFAFATHGTSAPSSLSPTGNNIAESKTPTFTGVRGNANDSLTSYQIQVYASDQTTLIWDTGTLTSGATTTGFSKIYSGTALADAGTYYWRARVTSSIGGTSAYSGMQQFRTPDTNTPAASSPVGSGVTSLTPTFTFTRTASFNRHEVFLYASDGTTQLWADQPASYTAATSKSVVYPGSPALTWGTTYKWKVRVSSDGGSNWTSFTGLVQFTTDKAGLPTLTAPASGAWVTTLTPTFTGTTFNSETIVTYRILLFMQTSPTTQSQVWDSGNLAGSGTSFSKVYNGSTALVKGATYFWQASYIKTGSVPGDYTAQRMFHVNADPSIPSALSPTASQIVTSLTPTFKATFEDADLSTWGDTPTNMTVEVYRNSDSVLMHTLSKSSGLVVGQNSVTRVAEGTALSWEVQYKYRVRYTDSKSAVGPWSEYVVFKTSQPPTVTITSPTTTVTSPSFLIAWTLSSPGGKSQGSYRVTVTRNTDGVVVYDTGIVNGSLNSFQMPGGYLVNNTQYVITVYSWDTDGLLAPP